MRKVCAIITGIDFIGEELYVFFQLLDTEIMVVNELLQLLNKDFLVRDLCLKLDEALFIHRG